MFNQAEAGGAMIYRNQNFTTFYKKEGKRNLQIEDLLTGEFAEEIEDRNANLTQNASK